MACVNFFITDVKGHMSKNEKKICKMKSKEGIYICILHMCRVASTVT